VFKKIIKKIIEFIKIWVRRILIACIDVIRPALGPDNVCIYEPDISCGNYAKELIATQPLYYALPRIGARLLFCNPITALYKYLKFKLSR